MGSVFHFGGPCRLCRGSCAASEHPAQNGTKLQVLEPAKAAHSPQHQHQGVAAPVTRLTWCPGPFLVLCSLLHVASLLAFTCARLRCQSTPCLDLMSCHPQVDAVILARSRAKKLLAQAALQLHRAMDTPPLGAFLRQQAAIQNPVPGSSSPPRLRQSPEPAMNSDASGPPGSNTVGGRPDPEPRGALAARLAVQAGSPLLPIAFGTSELMVDQDLEECVAAVEQALAAGSPLSPPYLPAATTAPAAHGLGLHDHHCPAASPPPPHPTPHPTRYRHIDMAESYGTEQCVGRALRRSGIPRMEVSPATHHHRRRCGVAVGVRARSEEGYSLREGQVPCPPSAAALPCPPPLRRPYPCAPP